MNHPSTRAGALERILHTTAVSWALQPQGPALQPARRGKPVRLSPVNLVDAPGKTSVRLPQTTMGVSAPSMLMHTPVM